METGDATPAAARRKRRRSRRRAKGGRRSDISAATRIEILKSAAASFRKLGYHGATVEQIAAALRMKKGNLYYYFKNKEDILFACHEYSHDRLQELLDDVRSTAPAEAKLRRLITGAVHVILDELHGTALLLDLEALSPAHLKAVVHRRDRFDRGMRLIIEEGMATGAFAPGDAKLLGFAMLGALNWIARWFNPAGPSRSEDIATRFADYLIAGLRPIETI